MGAIISSSATKTEYTALIVDDDDRIRKMLTELLGDNGFTCIVAETGEEAIAILQDSTPHIGVLDLALPGMSGAELAWKIRDKLPEVPLVALSGRLDIWDKEDLKDLGFTKIFAKPMNCDDFISTCRKVAATQS